MWGAREKRKEAGDWKNNKNQPPPSSHTQVVATTPEACALLRPAAEVGTLAGSIVLPGTSLAGLCLPAGGPSDAACCVHWASDETNQPTLIALAHAPPSPERSPAIADALLTVVDADAVVVVGSVPAHVVPGGGEGDTVFALPSSTAAPPAATTPLLPPGVALTGLTAALFSRLQASGRHAVALASVDACAGAPGAAALAALAAALSDALAGAGAPAAVIEALGKPVAAAVALDGADAVTSRSAVYV